MRTHRLPFVATLAIVAFGAACQPPVGSSSSSGLPAPATIGSPNCVPVETRAANAPTQTPAWPGQTRICGAASNVAFDVTVVAKLAKPWAVEPLPGGDLLVTEKEGNLRIVSASGSVGAPISGIPAVDARGQGGLLDVALSPNFNSDRTIFWSFSEARDGGNGTSIARGMLSADRTRLSDVRVIFRVLPAYNGQLHYGDRIAFGPDGNLYATFGERSDKPMRQYAQRLDSHLGKVIRIRPDGSVPSDNPFVGQPNAKPEIWSVGHRNPQSLAFDPQGRLWEAEHGTRGGDELNLIEKGKNYGWAEVAYGIEYSGEPIPNTVTQRAGTEQPVYYWDPVIAPSGMQWYTGDAFPAWRGSVFIGGMKDKKLVRLTLDGRRVTSEEWLLMDRNQRVRDVKQGPDGLLYIVTDETAGELWRISPRR